MLPYALILIFLGLANWLATTVLVEAEVTRDYRDWINKKYERASQFPGSKSAWTWYKLKYLVGCHLCTGVWVGFAMALFIPPMIPVPLVGYVLTALAIKAIGHVTLVFHKWGESVSSAHNATTRLNEIREKLGQQARGEWAEAGRLADNKVMSAIRESEPELKEIDVR